MQSTQNSLNISLGRLAPKEEVSMTAVVTLANGGYDKLYIGDVRIPDLCDGEVLINVRAAGVNNTEINTRLGWYSDSISSGTETLNFSGVSQQAINNKQDGGWNEQTPFPFIQGTDCAGVVVAVKNNENQKLLHKRCLIRSCQRVEGFNSLENIWMASDYDGAFSQFVKTRASEVFTIESNWSDAELGSLPCAYATAENMIHRCQVSRNDKLLITGASGGVGTALVQLCKRRGAYVIAVSSEEKINSIRSLGADEVYKRGEDLVYVLGDQSVTVILDNVGGKNFKDHLKLLKRGGRYASSGAIAGPIVGFDMRDFYLKDLSLIGCTAWDEPIFSNLISYVEKDEIKPLVYKTYPLADIVKAQKEFLEKKHVGKFVMIPPKADSEQLDFIKKKYPYS